MKKRRQEEIARLIRAHDVETQEELQKLLKKSGYDCTQATVSRDIKEMGLVKVQGKKGRYKYTLGQNAGRHMLDKYTGLFASAVVKIDCANNFVVVKCQLGMAQAVCAAIDTMEHESIVGTLAGEDTIFAILRTNETARGLVKELNELLG